jgi:hypothetical protein
VTLSIRRAACAALTAGAVAASLLVAGATHPSAHHASLAGGRVHFANTFAATPGTAAHVYR